MGNAYQNRMERIQEAKEIAADMKSELRAAFIASGLCNSESQVDNEVHHFIECLVTELAVPPKGGDDEG